MAVSVLFDQGLANVLRPIRLAQFRGYAAAVVICAPLLAGCTLPYEQLLLFTTQYDGHMKLLSSNEFIKNYNISGYNPQLHIIGSTLPLRAQTGLVPPPEEIVQCPPSTFGKGRTEIWNWPESFD